MRLTYWVAARQDDADAYSIRAKTRKAVVAELTEAGAVKVTDIDTTGETETLYRAPWGGCWSIPVKVTLEYADGFDLLTEALGADRAIGLMTSPGYQT